MSVKYPFKVIRRDGHILAKLRYIPDVEGAFYNWTGVIIRDDRHYDENWNTRDMPWGADPTYDRIIPPCEANGYRARGF